MTDHEQWDIASGVGVTALGVALCRAIETRRGGLAEDPYAEKFLAASALPPSMARTLPEVDAPTAELGPLWRSMPTYLGVRTRFFDEYLTQAGRLGVRQVVLIAAGLDTRAFRLDWAPGTSVFELDQARVLRFKDEVLREEGARPRCDRRVVAADLRDDWPQALCVAGFDPSRPTAWLVEGLLSFLPAHAEQALFRRLRELSVPGSWLALDSIAGDERDHVVDSPFAVAAAGTPFAVGSSTVWQTELRPDPIDVLRAAGWTVTVEPVADAARRYGRTVEGVMSVPATVTMLLTARR
ncbi:SAM-dependent methyltransferase [Micromonospora chersina]|uniref:SAM-dependent methyltransferase n=1 Tax=Micromonospora chersina TaxID=47854 RepID=UPI0033FD5647